MNRTGKTSISANVGLVLLGIIMLIFAYYVPIGVGFQLLVGAVGALFIIVGILFLVGDL